MKVENRASLVLGAMSLAAAAGIYPAFNTSIDSGNIVQANFLLQLPQPHIKLLIYYLRLGKNWKLKYDL